MTIENKTLAEVLAIAVMLGCTILLAAIWFAAAASGNDILLTINDYGERTPELVMWAIVMPPVAVGLQHWYRRPAAEK